MGTVIYGESYWSSQLSGMKPLVGAFQLPISPSPCLCQVVCLSRCDCLPCEAIVAVTKKFFFFLLWFIDGLLLDVLAIIALPPFISGVIEGVQ
jgi:hypothetical protein